MTAAESYRCAVVVFVEVPFAADQQDAEAAAEAAVGKNLRQVQTAAGGLRLQTDHGCEQVRVVKVREIGAAVRNGYLWTSPTSKAFPSTEPGEVSP